MTDTVTNENTSGELPVPVASSTDLLFLGSTGFTSVWVGGP